MYKANQGASAEAGPGDAPGGEAKTDDVVDADFEEVDGDKKE
jgi:hypothetical protein